MRINSAVIYLFVFMAEDFTLKGTRLIFLLLRLLRSERLIRDLVPSDLKGWFLNEFANGGKSALFSEKSTGRPSPERRVDDPSG